MVPTGSLTAFALTAALLIVVPGPSVLFVISRGVTLGRRAALLTVLGNAAASSASASASPSPAAGLTGAPPEVRGNARPARAPGAPNRLGPRGSGQV